MHHIERRPGRATVVGVTAILAARGAGRLQHRQAHAGRDAGPDHAGAGELADRRRGAPGIGVRQLRELVRR